MNTLRGLLEETAVRDLGLLPAPRLAPTATVHQALQFLARGRRGAIVIVDGMEPVGILTERDVLYRVADTELADAKRQKRMLVRDIMTRPVRTVGRSESLVDAIGSMINQGCRHLVVVSREGRLKGLLNTNDLVEFVTERFPEDTVNLPPRLHQQYLRPEGA